jgi:DMSO/TMAO reductase YedYZ molybdopterin-dependent catalytic subunit
LIVLNDRPVNAETPAHLLDDPVTPTERHFIRNNGNPPDATDAAGWKLTVDGEVEQPLELTIDDLRSRFETVTLQLQLECGGNGRAGFNPPASGNQWTVGAVGCAEWTGVRLADVLQAAGLTQAAVYTGHYGADSHLSGDPEKTAISRGVPMDKALDPYNLIAFEMNRGPLHPQNGAPLRLVIPGWPGSCSQKWLTRISVRDRIHDGEKMGGDSYRVPRYPVAPATEVPDAEFVIIHSMPVKSVITYPAANSEVAGA